MTEAEDKIQLKETFASRDGGVIPQRDYRFSAQCNQGGFCWTAFNELVLCRNKYGAEDSKCLSKHKSLLSQCPSEWITKWEEQKETPGQWLGVSESGPAKLDHTPFGPNTDGKVLSKHKH